MLKARLPPASARCLSTPASPAAGPHLAMQTDQIFSADLPCRSQITLWPCCTQILAVDTSRPSVGPVWSVAPVGVTLPGVQRLARAAGPGPAGKSIQV